MVGARVVCSLAAAGAILALLACPGPRPALRQTAGGAGGHGGAGGATAGSGGTAQCVPEGCPGSDTDCGKRNCIEGQCVIQLSAPGATCDDGLPNTKVCDGSGHCVECVTNVDCTSPETCDAPNHICVPASCSNGHLDPGETGIDCGGNAVSQCGACALGRGCNFFGDCQSHYCDVTGGPGQGGASTSGTCAVCTLHTQCVPLEWCDTSVGGGSCVAKRQDAEGCASDAECLNGHCVDGVCCNGACGASCEACNVVGAVGTCTPVPNGQQDSNTCSGVGDLCTGTGTCLRGIGSSCSASSQCAEHRCVDGVCCDAHCDHACDACTAALRGGGVDGVCGPVPHGLVCGSYVCNGTQANCPSNCATNDDCAPGFTCGTGLTCK